MIEKVNDKHLDFIVNVLRDEFDVKYSKTDYSKEYVYISDNEIAGFIIYDYIYDRIELDYIYVLPNKRKDGIASKLMEHMIEFSNEVNSINITLEVSENNIPACKLYQKYGFKICATRDRYYKNENAYLMIRE